MGYPAESSHRRLCPAPTEVGAAGRHEDDHDHRQRRRREDQPSPQGPPPDPLLEPQRGPLEAAGLRGQSVALPDQGVEAVPALQQGVDAGQDRRPQTRDLPPELRGGVGLPQVLGLLAESEESRKPSPGPHHQVAEHRPEGALAGQQRGPVGLGLALPREVAQPGLPEVLEEAGRLPLLQRGLPRQEEDEVVPAEASEDQAVPGLREEPVLLPRQPPQEDAG